MQPIRTVTAGNTEPVECAAQITDSIKILPVKPLTLYQKLAQKVKELHLLGITYEQIAKKLKTSRGTVENAVKYWLTVCQMHFLQCLISFVHKLT